MPNMQLNFLCSPSIEKCTLFNYLCYQQIPQCFAIIFPYLLRSHEPVCSGRPRADLRCPHGCPRPVHGTLCRVLLWEPGHQWCQLKRQTHVIVDNLDFGPVCIGNVRHGTEYPCGSRRSRTVCICAMKTFLRVA